MNEVCSEIWSFTLEIVNSDAQTSRRKQSVLRFVPSTLKAVIGKTQLPKLGSSHLNPI